MKLYISSLKNLKIWKIKSHLLGVLIKSITNLNLSRLSMRKKSKKLQALSTLTGKDSYSTCISVKIQTLCMKDSFSKEHRSTSASRKLKGRPIVLGNLSNVWLICPLSSPMGRNFLSTWAQISWNTLILMRKSKVLWSERFKHRKYFILYLDGWCLTKRKESKLLLIVSNGDQTLKFNWLIKRE